MASSNFRGHTVKACLHVIHKDVVTVWNFGDPDNVGCPSLSSFRWTDNNVDHMKILLTDDFKARLLDTPNLKVSEAQDIQKTV